MKIVVGKTSLVVRLGAMVAALLLGQQAMAVGTLAGTDIDNTVNVNYQVGGVGQAQLTSSVTFKVDRRVDFDLTLVGTALVPFTPGDTDAFFDVLLSNTSNSPLDFSIALTEIVAPATVRGVGDTGQMGTIVYAVNSVSENNQPGVPLVPARGAPGSDFVDELAPDDSIIIRVFGDSTVAIANGGVAGVQLDATAGEPGASGGEGDPLEEDPDTAGGVENVFAEGDAVLDGILTEFDGWIAVSAELAATKTNTIVGGGPAIPGATVEYTIAIVNSSLTVPATNISITDTLMAELTLVLGAFAGPPAASDFQIDNDGTLSGCTAVAGDDDCELAGSALTFDNLSIAADSTLTVKFRAKIRDTGLTTP